MKCSLGISNFPEEISSVSNSVVFLYFLEMITEEFFLIYIVADFIFFLAPKSLQMVTAAMKLKDAYSLEGKL